MVESNDVKDEVVLKVSPDVLVKKAESILKDVVVLKQALERIEQKIDGTRSYWTGEAGEQYRQIYNEQREEIRNIITRLEENPKRLMAIGDKYKDVDKEAVHTVDELMGNVII